MKSLFVSILLAGGLMVGGAGVFAEEAGEYEASETEQQTEQPAEIEATEQSGMGETGMTDEMRMRMSGVTGEVTSVEGDTIKIQDKSGVTRSFEITGDQSLEELSAETIQVGDKVHIQFQEQGTEVEIHKISESGSGIWMMEETGAETDAMEGSESGTTTQPAEGDFESETRTPAEGDEESDPTQQ